MPAAFCTHRNKNRLSVNRMFHKSRQQVQRYTAGNQHFQKREHLKISCSVSRKQRIYPFCVGFCISQPFIKRNSNHNSQKNQNITLRHQRIEIVRGNPVTFQAKLRQMSPPCEPHRKQNCQHEQQQRESCNPWTSRRSKIVVKNQQMIKTCQWKVLNCGKLYPHSRNDIKSHNDSDSPFSPGKVSNPHTDSKDQPAPHKLIERKSHKRL